MKKSRLNLILLVVILTGALIVRLTGIGSNPPGFFCDEAIRGLDAYYLLTTGKDSHQKPFPVFFEVFGEYTPPLQTYSEIPSILLFGLTEKGVRIPAAIFGVISVLLTYLIAKNLFSVPAGLTAALIMALAPWTVHYSRTGFEYNIYLVFFLTSILYWIKGKTNHIYWVVSSLFWALTLYTYNPAKLTVPIFLFGLWLSEIKNFKKYIKWLGLSLAVIVVVSLPMIGHVISGKGLIRFNQVSIFNGMLDRKDTIMKMVKNYFDHYSPDFLFFKGDPRPPNNRHFSLGLKPLPSVLMPLIILGLIGLLLREKNKKVLMVWLLVYPISGVPLDLISTNRAIVGLPMLAILAALGVSLLWKSKRWWRYPVLGTLGLIFLFQTYQTGAFYFNKYPNLSADFWGWQYGPKEIMKYFLEYKDSYDELYMSGEYNAGGVFLKFYDPENLCSDKCKLGDLWRDKDVVDLNKRQLFALSPDFLNQSGYANRFLTKRTVVYPDGKVAFLIGEII